MKAFPVYLKADIESVKSFVNEAMKFKFDIDISQGRYTVDGKSIIGVFSLNLLDSVRLKIYSNDFEEVESFMEAVSKYVEPIK